MNTKSIIAVALAALLVFAGGAAAMPGNAPDDPGSDAAEDHAPDDPDDDAGNETDDDRNETDGNATDAGDDRAENASDGPPTEMPEPVPDHVTEIHQLIRDKLAGGLTGQELGEAISSIFSGNSDEAEANSQADAADEESETGDDTQSDAEDADENASGTGEDAQSNDANAGPPSSLPDQAADKVSQIHDAILSFLSSDGDGNPGDAVSSAGQG